MHSFTYIPHKDFVNVTPNIITISLGKLDLTLGRKLGTLLGLAQGMNGHQSEEWRVRRLSV